MMDSHQQAYDVLPLENGQTLPLLRRLGSGLTAEVYETTWQGEKAAVKVLRLGVSDEIRKLFREEAMHLRNIRQKWNEQYEERALPIPNYLAGQFHTEPQFLIMEFIAGRPLDAVLGDDKKLSEAQAVTLMVQFGHLLHVLHEGYGKCYADIKIENLWILPPEEQPRLKVTDWNVLSDFSPEGQERDLLYASIFLCRILLGVRLTPLGGQVTVRRLEDLPGFAELSHGMQRFLRQAFHRNRAMRFMTAKAWVEELQRLADWWQKDPAALNEEAGKFLDDADKAVQQKQVVQARQAFWMADAVLSISDLKGRGSRKVWADLHSDLEKGLQQTSALDQGLLYLKGDSYEKAVQEFEQGAQRSVGDAAALWRWYWAAVAAREMGLENFKQIKEQVIDAVEKLLREEFEAARDAFEQILRILNEKTIACPAALQALYGEALILWLSQQAQRAMEGGNFESSIENFRKAKQIFKTLPIHPETGWADKAGNLDEAIQYAEKQRQSFGRAHTLLQNAQNALQNQAWVEAAENFQQALFAVPGYSKVIEQWEKAIRAQMEAGNANAALLLCEKAFGMAGAGDRIEPLARIIHDLLGFLKDLRAIPLEPDKKEEAEQALQQLYSRMSDFERDWRGDRFVLGEMYLGVAEQALHQSVVWGNQDLIEKWFELILTIDPSRRQQLQGDINELIRLYQQRIYERVVNSLQLIDGLLQQHEFEQAKDKVRAAKFFVAFYPQKTGDDYTILQRNIQESQNKIEEAEKEIKEKVERQQEQILRCQAALMSLQERMNRIRSKIEGLSFDSPEEVTARRALESSYQELLVQALALASRAHELNPLDEKLKSQIVDLKQQLEKFSAWPKLAHEAEQFLAQQREIVVEMQRAYAAGNLEQAERLLEPIRELQIARDVRQQIERTRQFKEQVATDQNCDNYKTWLSWNIPAVYWQRFGAIEILQRKGGEMLRGLPHPRQVQDFSQKLSKAASYFVAAQQVIGTKQTAKPVALSDLVLLAMDYAKHKQKRVSESRLIEALKSLRSSPDAEAIRQSMPVPFAVSPRMFWFGAALLLMGLLIGLGMGKLVLWDLLSPTAVPEPVITLQPTATDLPTPTPTPTLEPPPTLEPTSTLEPTPAVVLLTHTTQIPYPEQLSGLVLTDAFLIQEDRAHLIKDTGPVGFDQNLATWNDGGLNGFWTLNLMGGNQKQVEWQAEPLPADRGGRYEVFAFLPKESNLPYQKDLIFSYEVWVGDVKIEPALGKSVTDQQAYKCGNDTSPECAVGRWVSIGVYDLQSDQPISIRLTTSYSGTLMVDAVMLVPFRVDPVFEQQFKFENVVSLDDDPKNPWLSKSRYLISPSSWHGAWYYNQEDMGELTWTLRLPASGTYDLYLRLSPLPQSQTSTPTSSQKFKALNITAKELELNNLKLPQTEDWQTGGWFKIGSVTSESTEPQDISVVLSTGNDRSGIFIVDAMVAVKP